MGPVLAIQGGAGPAGAPSRREGAAASLQRIARASFAILSGGGSAVDAAVDAVARLEDDPRFNAGLGAKLQRDGRARVSASLMDGSCERFAGVINAEGVAHPVRLARALLEERDRVLAGAGAEAAARRLGLAERDNRTERAIAAWRRRLEGETGTVGAVALDAAGRLAAATSTGGRGFEGIGRVSDSCTVAGNFAGPAAAVSTTGVGEEIVDAALAARLVTLIESGASLAEACARLEARLMARGWRAGWIALDRGGDWAAHHTTEAMSWAVIDDRGIAGFWQQNPL